MKKGLTLLLILILTVSSPVVMKHERVLAESPTPTLTITPNPTAVPTPTPVYSKPAISEFILTLLSSPSEVNKTIDLTIKNQPFTSYYDASSGFNITMYYNVRTKGHNEENWTNLYLVEDVIPAQPNSEYTILSYPSEQANNENTYILGDTGQTFPPGTQVDFQVNAMIGYVHRVLNPNANGNPMLMFPYVFTGEESGFSKTQTLTISNSNSIPEFPSTLLIITFLCIATLLGTAATVRKQLKKKLRWQVSMA